MRNKSFEYVNTAIIVRFVEYQRTFGPRGVGFDAETVDERQAGSAGSQPRSLVDRPLYFVSLAGLVYSTLPALDRRFIFTLTHHPAAD